VKYVIFLAFFSFAVMHTPVMSQSPNALGARNVQDYFQDVESKSYYQQERIRSMKGEMNEYSERLHGLQEKFHKIFYGSSTNELYHSPLRRLYEDPPESLHLKKVPTSWLLLWINPILW
jgi:hypothetical protein